MSWYTRSPLHDDDDLVSRATETGYCRCCNTLQGPTLLCVGVEGALHLVRVELPREPLIFLGDDLVLVRTRSLRRSDGRIGFKADGDGLEHVQDVRQCRLLRQLQVLF